MQHENGLHWHAGFYGVDLSTIEIANINDALSMLSAAESIAVNPNEDIPKAVPSTPDPFRSVSDVLTAPSSNRLPHARWTAPRR